MDKISKCQISTNGVGEYLGDINTKVETTDRLLKEKMTKFRPEKYNMASTSQLDKKIKETRGYLNERISYILSRMDMLETDFAACNLFAPTEDVDAPGHIPMELGKFSFNPELVGEDPVYELPEV